jgi:hypothetical protein
MKVRKIIREVLLGEDKLPKVPKISAGAEIVLSMRRGREFTDRKKQLSKKSCRKWRHNVCAKTGKVDIEV